MVPGANIMEPDLSLVLLAFLVRPDKASWNSLKVFLEI
jgi:hypothetical protein